MEGKVLFDISHLRFDRKAQGIVNGGMFYLSNDDKIREEFYTEIYIKQYGMGDTSYIPDSVFGYTTLLLGDTDMQLNEDIQMKFEEAMFERVRYIETLLTSLWFVQDNSVGLFSTIGEITSRRLVGKLSQSISYWNSSGQKGNVIFNKEQIMEAIDFSNKYNKINSKKFPEIKSLIVPTEFDQNGKPYKKYIQRVSNNFQYNEQNCIERAFNFLITARSQSYIIYKIAYYMAVFESLFTTSSSEITTRMSYRVAFYIGSSAEQCKDIFNTIYKAYDIRSKFLHGQKFNSDKDIEIKRLIALSNKLDDILRKAFRKIINDDSEIFTEFSNDDRDRYFNSLVFDLPFERTHNKK